MKELHNDYYIECEYCGGLENILLIDNEYICSKCDERLTKTEE